MRMRKYRNTKRIYIIRTIISNPHTKKTGWLSILEKYKIVFETVVMFFLTVMSIFVGLSANMIAYRESQYSYASHMPLFVLDVKQIEVPSKGGGRGGIEPTMLPSWEYRVVNRGGEIRNVSGYISEYLIISNSEWVAIPIIRANGKSYVDYNYKEKEFIYIDYADELRSYEISALYSKCMMQNESTLSEYIKTGIEKYNPDIRSQYLNNENLSMFSILLFYIQYTDILGTNRYEVYMIDQGGTIETFEFLKLKRASGIFIDPTNLRRDSDENALINAIVFI